MKRTVYCGACFGTKFLSSSDSEGEAAHTPHFLLILLLLDCSARILRLQDLGMIHRVERPLIYLTFVTLLVNVITILLEADIFKSLTSLYQHAKKKIV